MKRMGTVFAGMIAAALVVYAASVDKPADNEAKAAQPTQEAWSVTPTGAAEHVVELVKQTEFRQVAECLMQAGDTNNMWAMLANMDDIATAGYKEAMKCLKVKDMQAYQGKEKTIVEVVLAVPREWTEDRLDMIFPETISMMFGVVKTGDCWRVSDMALGMDIILCVTVVPGYVEARRKSQTRACIANMRNIDTAIQQGMIEQPNIATNWHTSADISPTFLKNPKSIQCPLAKPGTPYQVDPTNMEVDVWCPCGPLGDKSHPDHTL